MQILNQSTLIPTMMSIYCDKREYNCTAKPEFSEFFGKQKKFTKFRIYSAKNALQR